MSATDLRSSYNQSVDTVTRFCGTMLEQAQSLCRANELTLAVPIEHRVKSWQSIEEKLERKPRQLKGITELDDLVGIRLILLFQRDVEHARRMICDTFVVRSEEDTASRLQEGQFGYQSWHYIIEIPEAWCAVPTFAPFKGLRAEVQVRTLAQHMWAAASHKLQYKQESNVPLAVRRSILRVSALLETVDLEFERVLQERAAYKSSIRRAPDDAPLDVDVLASVLDETLPAANKGEIENWAELLLDLTQFNILSAGQLRKVIGKHHVKILEKEADEVAKRREAANHSVRLARGVFYMHVGLVRLVLAQEFGDEWIRYTSAKRRFRRKLPDTK